MAYESLERYRKAYVDYKTVLQIDISVQAAHDSVHRYSSQTTQIHMLFYYTHIALMDLFLLYIIYNGYINTGYNLTVK